MREFVMASSPDVVEYICFQLRHAGDISFRKMFGDYGLYCGRTFFGLVCDNQLYVKITESGLKMFPQQEQGCPYPGARPHFLVTDLDDGPDPFLPCQGDMLHSGCSVCSGGEKEKGVR